MIREAIIDETEHYRYRLSRNWNMWGVINSQVCWIMLNPSTADAKQDDPTIRRCMNFSTLWGHDSMVVVNLYAHRATNPKFLLDAKDPIGPENANYIYESIADSDLVIAAWGAFKLGVPEDIKFVLKRADELFCLGTTKAGHPKHPLYVKASQMPERFIL